MIRSKDETEKLLLSILKNCETLNKQTHIKRQETLEFETNKPRDGFSVEPPLTIEKSWMIGLPSLKVSNSIFNITEQINKYELYTDSFDEFSFEQLKDEIEEILKISNISHEHLQGEIIGRLSISAYRKLETKKRRTDGYYMLLLGYARSTF